MNDRLSAFQGRFLSHYQTYYFRRGDFIVAGLCLLASCVFYTLNMTPSISAGDNGELTTAMYYLGIAHAPGYPLHSLIGKLATFLPFQNVAWRANFFSALCGSVTIYFAVLVYLKILVSCRIPRETALVVSVLTGIAYMLSETLWSQSIMCEVYTMSAIFHPLSFLILLKWIDEVITHRDAERPYLGESYLLAYAFLFGVAMAGHMTIVITNGLALFTIIGVLTVFVFMPRKLTGEQLARGLAYAAFLIAMLFIAYGFYYYYIMRLDSNLYNVSNVRWGVIPFIICNLLLLVVYLFDRFLASERIDSHNPLQLAFYTVVKMLGIFYLGYGIHLYMFIRSHGNPPINWMGISEAENNWVKMGKFFNAIWRKQYGDTGKLSMTTSNLIKEFKLVVTYIHGAQFTAPLYVVALLGLIHVFRRNAFYAAMIVFAVLTYNLQLTPFLRFNFDKRALFFVKVFYIFSYFCISIFIAFGLALLIQYLEILWLRVFPRRRTS